MMRNPSMTACCNNRSTVLLVSLGALGIGVTAVILASTLGLEACHLCIFQRLVYFVIGAVLLISFFVWNLPRLRIATLAAAAEFSAWGPGRCHAAKLASMVPRFGAELHYC